MIAAKFSGRIGNLALEIFNVFWYAQHKNIPFDNIVFDLGYNATCCSWKKHKDHKSFNLENYIYANIGFFKNIEKHFMLSYNYSISTANYEVVDFIEAFNSNKKYDNIMLANVPANTYYMRQDMQMGLMLFKQLFYNACLVNYNKKRYDSIRQRIAIHIRRTDYVDYKDGKYLLSKQQIDDAINKYIAEGNTKFAVFSDDIEWCKDNVQHDGVDIVFIEPDLHDYNDLVLMSLCKDIFKNGGHSSFSTVASLLHKCYKV